MSRSSHTASRTSGYQAEDVVHLAIAETAVVRIDYIGIGYVEIEFQGRKSLGNHLLSACPVHFWRKNHAIGPGIEEAFRFMGFFIGRPDAAANRGARPGSQDPRPRGNRRRCVLCCETCPPEAGKLEHRELGQSDPTRPFQCR